LGLRHVEKGLWTYTNCSPVGRTNPEQMSGDAMSRKRRGQAYSPAYVKKFRWLNCCVYCGGPHQAWDHVMPASLTAGVEFWRPGVRQSYRQGLNLVPCCHECNSLAGDSPFISITAKRKYIKRLLAKRYSKHSQTVIWDREELIGLGRTLKTHIIRGQQKCAVIEARLSWPATKTRVTVFNL
jgi:5-methylcytosine-specific restriction endonuclease McrA